MALEYEEARRGLPSRLKALPHAVKTERRLSTPTVPPLRGMLLAAGVYLRGLWYPVVPKGEARLRAQVSAALSTKEIDRALDAFEKVGKNMNLI